MYPRRSPSQKAGHTGTKDRRTSGQMNPHKHVYNSAAWKKLRLLRLAEEPLCAHCEKQGIIRPAREIDHIIPMSEGGLAFDDDNLQNLCKECHSRKTLDEVKPRKPYLGACGADGWPTDIRHPVNGGDGRLSKEYQDRVFPPNLKPSRIPLEIVCGPPGGGKSSYVRAQAGKDDLTIDLDAIMARLSGLPEHMTLPKYLNQALQIRNTMLLGLATDTTHAKAYFIISAADPGERRRWHEALGGTVVVIAPPLEDCIEQITLDPARHGLHNRMIAKAKGWWIANPHLEKWISQESAKTGV